MKRVSVFVAAMLLAGIGLASNAEEPVTQFHTIGTVDAIDGGNSTIVVNDVQLRLATDTSVRGPSGETMVLSEIVPGMRVGLSSDAGAAGASDPIAEIWVLPESSSPSGSEE